MKHLTLLTRAIVFLVTLFLSIQSWSAYCSLRNPVTTIFTLFPDANQHESIVRPITQETRLQVAEQLPFTLHYNELGMHTLYVVRKDARPAGFVHARSELSPWGIIEIAWAFDVDLKIRDLYFQRCRISACSESLRENVLQDIGGKTFDELVSLLSEEGEQLNDSLKQKYQEDFKLVSAIIKSALKTSLATRLVWHEEVLRAQRTRFSYSVLGEEQTIQLIPRALNTSHDFDLEMYTGLKNSHTSVFAVVSDGVEKARLVDARWPESNARGEAGFSLLFSSKGKVLGFQAMTNGKTIQPEYNFGPLIDSIVNDSSQCTTGTGLSAHTLFLTAY